MKYKEKSIEPLMENLEKVEGNSLEDILKFLDRRISGFVEVEFINHGNVYINIRCHNVRISEKDYKNIYKKAIEIGADVDSMRVLNFYAYYKPTKNFNCSNLDGVYEFNKGRLVEKIAIIPPNPFTSKERKILKKYNIK